MTNKELIQKFHKAINDRDFDTMLGCVADDFVNHSALPSAQGASGLRLIIGKVFKAMPDARATVNDLIAEGDRVVCRMTMTGTNTGPSEFVRFPHAATGKSATVEQIHIFRIANGKIVEHWATRDDIAMFRQLGIAPFAVKEVA